MMSVKLRKPQRNCEIVFRSFNRSKDPAVIAGFLPVPMIILAFIFSVATAAITTSQTIRSSGNILASIPTPTATYQYTIGKQGSNTVVMASNGTILFSSPSANAAFAKAFSYVASGGNITVQAGTYIANGAPILMDRCVNVKVNFEPGSLLTITNWANTYVFRMEKTVNCSVIGININGNGAYQASSYLSTGLLLYCCSNSNVTGAYITNTGGDCFAFLDEEGGKLPCYLTYSTLTFGGWNGVTLGSEYPYSKDTPFYVLNNKIAYCSNVGISLYYAPRSVVANNYIYDMNGTTGGIGGNAHLGISIETSMPIYAIITNNTILNSAAGLWAGGRGNSSFLFKNNIITNCTTGIYVDSYNNVITNNTITEWGGTSHWNWRKWAIYDDQTENNIVSFNTLKSSNTTLAQGIAIHNSKGSIYVGNTISLSTSAATSQGILVGTATSNTIISKNNIQAKQGIVINSGCVSNKIDQNILENCTIQISDSGTDTIVNPTSQSIYSILFNSVYDGSATGKYTYSNTTQIRIGISLGGILNINGSNVTLTANAYTLVMNQDHFAYVVGGSATLTILSAG